MLDIHENFSLKKYNTLALEQSARYFVEINTPDDVKEALQFASEKKIPWVVIGGGSNLIVSQDYPGLVIYNQLKGIEFIESKNKKENKTKSETDNKNIFLKAAAGENWHDLVKHTLQEGYYGLENLALIPGTVGAAPVQNIGAYGLELSDVFVELEAWDTQTHALVVLNKTDCCFAYRDSVFKQNPQRYIIVSVTLCLSSTNKVNVSYKSLADYFENRSSAEKENKISAQDVFDAVVKIRSEKLPNPDDIPNAGSFFKNPVIDANQHAELKQKLPNLVSYPQANNQHKLAAGWLIEQAGWKGKREGDIGVHDKQALVLVNHSTKNGQASGQALLSFAQKIQQDIQQRYGVQLDIEPVIL